MKTCADGSQPLLSSRFEALHRDGSGWSDPAGDGPSGFPAEEPRLKALPGLSRKGTGAESTAQEGLGTSNRARRPRGARAAALLVAGVIGLVGVIGLAACGDDPAGPVDLPLASSFTASVDGLAWEASPSRISATNSGDTLLAVTAADASGAFIVFAVPAAATGSYTVGPAWASYFFDEGLHHWVADGSQGSGTILITTLSENRIAGTIAFEAVAVSEETNPTVRVTDGVFDIVF